MRQSAISSARRRDSSVASSVVQATTAGVSAEGVPVRVPTCLVVQVVDGKIARFEEYADSAQARALFGGEAKDEHFGE